MTHLESKATTKPQVIISYANADRVVASSLVKGLRSKGLDMWLDEYELPSVTNWIKSIRNVVSANAYFILLLSKNLIPFFCGKEAEALLKELQSRDITFIPVLLEDCNIPSSLTTYQWFDMRNPVGENLEKFAAALRSTPKIDFDKLSPQMFERMVVELLQKLGFVYLQPEALQTNNGVHAIVEFRHQDPFGAETLDVYALETKLYRESRADLRSLRELALYAKSDPNIDKALLVTDGNLTSVALDWVNDAPKVTGVPIRVVNGTELKRLLLQNTDLVSKYFATNIGAITA